jgi:hypothetical protein
VVVPIQAVQKRDSVVNVYRVIGGVESFLAVCFHQKPNEPMTGLLSSSLMSGVRN